MIPPLPLSWSKHNRADLHAYRSIRKPGLEPAVRCTIHEGPLRAVSRHDHMARHPVRQIRLPSKLRLLTNQYHADKAPP